MVDGAVGDIAGVDGLERSERVLYHHVSSPRRRGREYAEVRLPYSVALTSLDAKGLPGYDNRKTQHDEMERQEI